MRTGFIFSLTLWCILSAAQIPFEGNIGKFEIEFVLNVESEYADGIYMYTNYNLPIAIKGKIRNKNLDLFEYEGDKITGKFAFENFKKDQFSYTGTWTNLKTKTTYPFILKRKKVQTDILQAESGKRFMYKVSKENEVTFVNAYDKKSGKIIIKTPIDCNSRGSYDIGVEDYNFDGYEDFSACVQYFAGPNTSKIYYLFDTKSNSFKESDFYGIALEFDPINKKIHETNQSGAGASIIKNVYIVKNNQMILKEEHCFKRNEKTNKMVEKKPKDCY